MKRKVLVISTGGTIEKTYDESEGSLTNRESLIREGILAKLRLPYTQVEVHSILSKDSLDLTDEDRNLIVDELQKWQGENHPIVVLHGTDTLEKTVRLCSQELVEPKVAIVFTGAMKPWAFMDSDAKQNLVEALMAAKIVKQGIYVSFHGQLFSAPHVRKNKERGTFEVTDS